jgi:hypothetical protein
MWKAVKKEFLLMVQGFNEDKLDLKRLNYRVITLVPKVVEASTIKQFRPICLLNTYFKIFPKLMNDRLTLVADKLISESQ